MCLPSHPSTDIIIAIVHKFTKQIVLQRKMFLELFGG